MRKQLKENQEELFNEIFHQDNKENIDLIKKVCKELEVIDKDELKEKKL